VIPVHNKTSASDGESNLHFTLNVNRRSPNCLQPKQFTVFAETTFIS